MWLQTLPAQSCLAEGNFFGKVAPIRCCWSSRTDIVHENTTLLFFPPALEPETWPGTWPLPDRATPGKKGPIALLMERQIEVRVKNTLMPKPFTFAYTDPKKDYDVSRNVEGSGYLEAGISKVGKAVHPPTTYCVDRAMAGVSFWG